jgi:putative Holliday junction resolvase
MATTEYFLGIDYGEKRVGVAIAHQVARLPRPLTTLANTSGLVEDIQALVEQEGAKLVVVGLPRGMDGGYTEQTRLVEVFAQKLAAALAVPVELTDETLTSVDAENYLGQRKSVKSDIDAQAAAYILERYLAEHPVGKDV